MAVKMDSDYCSYDHLIKYILSARDVQLQILCQEFGFPKLWESDTYS